MNSHHTEALPDSQHETLSFLSQWLSSTDPDLLVTLENICYKNKMLEQDFRPWPWVLWLQPQRPTCPKPLCWKVFSRVWNVPLGFRGEKTGQLFMYLFLNSGKCVLQGCKASGGKKDKRWTSREGSEKMLSGWAFGSGCFSHVTKIVTARFSFSPFWSSFFLKKELFLKMPERFGPVFPLLTFIKINPVGAE